MHKMSGTAKEMEPSLHSLFSSQFKKQGVMLLTERLRTVS